MPSNSLSRIFGITTFGESHGPAIGILFDSPVANQDFPYDRIREALLRRAPRSNSSTARKENDDLEIISGVFNGKTTGAPLCILIRNQDARSLDYEPFKDLIRPGYADYSWLQKYHIFDYRGGGRASGRETVARILAAQLLRDLIPDISIETITLQIGKLSASLDGVCEPNYFHWPDRDTYPKLLRYIEQTKQKGDSLGGIIRVVARNVPAGLGDPIYEKLSANIAKAMFSIGTVRGILFGDGHDLASLPGSECNDQFVEGKCITNHHGGILGGVSTGQELRFDLVFRPVSSISLEQETVDYQERPSRIKLSGRHDSCHIPRVIPVCEAMLTICLADAIQYQRLNSGKQDLAGYREALDKLDEDLLLLLKRRREIVQQVKEYKLANHLAPKDPIREEEILQKATNLAQELDLDVDLVLRIMKLNLLVSAK